MQCLAKFGGDYEQQKDSHPRRISGTGFWLFSDARFRAWRRSRDACLLHVVGPPLCGKSVLMRNLIEDDLDIARDNAAVCWYFVTPSNAKTTTASKVIAALLHELCSTNRIDGDGGGSLVSRKLEAAGFQLENMRDVMWENILDVCDHLKRNIVCIVDGLDDCPVTERDILIDMLNVFYSSTRAQQTKLKFLVTSRSDGVVDFEVRPQADRRIFALISAEEMRDTIAMEMHRVVRTKMRRTAISEDLQDAIIVRLKGIENKTYLWLNLLLDYLTQGSTRSIDEIDLDEVFRQMPKDHIGLYKATYERSPDRLRTSRLLAIVLVAQHPMDLREIQYAIQLMEQSHSDLTEVQALIKPEDEFWEEVQQLCGMLVELVDDQVHIRHPSVRDFLHHDPDHQAPAEPWQVEHNSAHCELALACFRFLELCSTIPYPFAHRGSGPPDNEILLWLEEFGFLKYAAGFWAYHYQNAGKDFRGKLLPWLPKLLAETEDKTSSWIEAYGIVHHRSLPYTTESLLFVVRNGLDDYVKRLLEADKAISPWVAIGAVRSAAKHKKKNLVRMLLDYMTAQNIHQQENAIQLQHQLTDSLPTAAAEHELEIFDMLIEFLRAGDYSYPLGLAVLETILKTHDNASLRRVLEFPSGINVTVNQLIDCLKVASARPIAVEMILRYKARRGDLSHTTWQRLVEPVMDTLREETVNMLLDEFPEFSSGTWRVLLEGAISERQLELVRLLLGRYSVLVDLPAYCQGLLVAASSDLKGVLRELLMFHHADLDANKIAFQNAFDCAAEGKHYGAMELLLADGRVGRYAGISHMLYNVAVEGHVEPTRALLEHINKIKLEHTDDLHLALEGAAGNGCMATVDILLSYSMQTDSLPENTYRSALNNAARNDHDDVVQLLLDKGPKQLSSRHAATFRDTEEQDMVVEKSKADNIDDEPLFNEDELELDESDGDEVMSDASDDQDLEE